ncbi:hypothetical protein SAMN05192559_103280 [Halobacillus karajensis]|uniref:Inner spore coat protein n=1 Tax=Halobacillus karajensis TaxID=195088 RepID=A0A024P2T8_9BACI|nr:hypothetical protein [Halobacillus karajensis]CDQ19781.1 hypothetical protein BN982_02083 [Halobacillus karajensis]CDQ22241.1 hypothetical protein BN983_00444 [Halobacillus karajensis]CDQ28082.1 hypothetical protein BN981_02371 [Halobacillus karajensis]SEH72278.1 hypothetical protein SAMN05192559_103280 [Halobacillus karajensis]
MYVLWVPYYIPVVNPSQYLHPYPQPYNRIYPEVDEDLFVQSASSMERLMDDARKVVERISHSHEFANEVMGAAQEADQTKIDTLIQSTGLESPFKAEYNPDRLRLQLTSSYEQVECCQLVVVLRWR